MKNLIIILLLFNPLSILSDYPLKNGKPTSKGIEQYIEDKSELLITEYQDFIGDTLYQAWIYAEDLRDYNAQDSLEMGRYFPHEIYISTEESFLAYELADLSDSERSLIAETNKFVKATVFHELTHEYINQIGREMQYVDMIDVNRSYQTYIWIIRTYETFGSTFIEEGICEYMTEKMGEIIPPKRPFIPLTEQELTNRNNRYNVNYKYSSHYLKTFLDTTGFKRGVKILLYNAPPTLEEILDPALFFSKLNPISK